jgi:hypothetical protein
MENVPGVVLNRYMWMHVGTERSNEISVLQESFRTWFYVIQCT